MEVILIPLQVESRRTVSCVSCLSLSLIYLTSSSSGIYTIQDGRDNVPTRPESGQLTSVSPVVADLPGSLPRRVTSIRRRDPGSERSANPFVHSRKLTSSHGVPDRVQHPEIISWARRVSFLPLLVMSADIAVLIRC